MSIYEADTYMETVVGDHIISATLLPHGAWETDHRLKSGVPVAHRQILATRDDARKYIQSVGANPMSN